ncbi:hypothetical protein ANN_07730 [Periplaneta americana]|uniref:Gustatory receptor n=1 Tax=Periplaneta americana TaxID=6978 RepID=A0ABQ8SZD7_PERAM|nr:hypothetical protein ANN_07730 [Periplaneta americana]
MIADALRSKNLDVHEEVHCIADGGRNRRIDIIAINRNKQTAEIIDPTIRFEISATQPSEVNEEEKKIYEPTIQYLSAKYNIEKITVTGLFFGARGTIPKAFHRTTGDDPPGPDWVAIPGPGGLVKEVKERKVTSREEREERLETEDVQHLGDITDEGSPGVNIFFKSNLINVEDLAGNEAMLDEQLLHLRHEIDFCFTSASFDANFLLTSCITERGRYDSAA